MKSKVRTKSKSSLGSDDTNYVQGAFEKMMGSQPPDVAIVEPKYREVFDAVRSIATNLSLLNTALVSKYEEHEQYVDPIGVWVGRIRELKESDEKSFKVDDYLALKSEPIINEILVVCGNLSPISSHLKKKWDEVDDKFINRIQTSTFTPFPFANIDIKRLWQIDCNTDDEHELIFTILHHIFLNSYKLYKTTTSPDIDISKFSEIIVKALVGLKSQLPRCGKAFKKIEESVGMLENNFGEYHKDFVMSGDPTNIFTSFLGDVAGDCDSDPQLIFQCRRIVSFYKKNAAKNAAMGKKGGKNSAMLDSLMSKFSIIDKKVAATMNIDDDEEEYEEEVAVEENMPPLESIDDIMDKINDPTVLSIK
jgi:hypothetical protein